MTADSFLDHRPARFVAGLIGVGALTGMAFVWLAAQNVDPAGNSLNSAALTSQKLNPAFVECRNKRLADIDGMLESGVINQAQHDEFAERAVENCAGMFPPDA